jgi:hypothetical protein
VVVVNINKNGITVSNTKEMPILLKNAFGFTEKIIQIVSLNQRAKQTRMQSTIDI